jgi:Flp pilus assembly protein TadD
MKLHRIAAAAGLTACLATIPLISHAQTAQAGRSDAITPLSPAELINPVLAPAAPPSPATPAPAEKSDHSPAGASPDDAGRQAQLIYEVLLGELNADSGNPGTGFSLLLDAARRNNDAGLFRRATEVALEARSGESALRAARAWAAAQPDSREANRYVLQILVALNRVPESAVPLERELALGGPLARSVTYAAIPPVYARVTDKAAAEAVVEKALAQDLANPATPADGVAAWVAVGRMRLAAGDSAGTLEAALKAQGLDPGAEGPALLALHLVSPTQPLAEPIVRRYLETGKAPPEFRLEFARLLMEADRNADAAIVLAALSIEHPEFPEGWLLRGSLEAQEDHYDVAQTSIQKYLDLTNAQLAGAKPDKARSRVMSEAYVVMSQIAEKRGDMVQARAWLDKVTSPEVVVGARLRRASLLAKSGKLDEARELIRSMPERTPADARLKMQAEVQLLRDNGRQADAFKLLQEQQKAHPDDADLLYDLAMGAEQLGRHDESERLLRKLIAQKPDYHQAYNALGYSMAERGRKLPEARELIRKAVSFAPDDPFIQDSLGWVEYRMGHLAEASKILQGAFVARPDPEIAAHFGEVLWKQGQQERAKAIWREGVQLSPDNKILRDTLKRLKVKL